MIGAVVTGAHDGVYGTNYYPGAGWTTDSTSEIAGPINETAS